MRAIYLHSVLKHDRLRVCLCSISSNLRLTYRSILRGHNHQILTAYNIAPPVQGCDCTTSESAVASLTHRSDSPTCAFYKLENSVPNVSYQLKVAIDLRLETGSTASRMQVTLTFSVQVTPNRVRLMKVLIAHVREQVVAMATPLNQVKTTSWQNREAASISGAISQTPNAGSNLGSTSTLFMMQILTI
jgi:hypothetical protein